MQNSILPLNWSATCSGPTTSLAKSLMDETITKQRLPSNRIHPRCISSAEPTRGFIHAKTRLRIKTDVSLSEGKKHEDIPDLNLYPNRIFDNTHLDG